MWIFSIRFVNPCKLSKFLLGIISTYSIYMSTWNVIENRIVKRETFTCTCVCTWLLLLLQPFCLYIAFVKLQATFWHNSSWALVRSRNSENEKRNWHLSFNSLLPHKILILYEKLRRNKNKNKPSFHGHWVSCEIKRKKKEQKKNEKFLSLYIFCYFKNTYYNRLLLPFLALFINICILF